MEKTALFQPKRIHEMRWKESYTKYVLHGDKEKNVFEGILR